MSALFGRLFQVIGMILLPLGLIYGLARNEIDVEVRLLFIGAGFFVAGWLMSKQRRA